MLRLATALFLIGHTAVAEQAPPLAREGVNLTSDRPRGDAPPWGAPGNSAHPGDSAARAEPTSVPTISQGARLWWDQTESARVPISAHRFRLFVDGGPSDELDARCSAIGDGNFACSAVLPWLDPGVHQLSVAASAAGEADAHSAPLEVQIGVPSPPGPGDGPPDPGQAPPPEATPVHPVSAVQLPDQQTLVGDLAGRLYLAQRGEAVASPAIDVDDVTTGEGRGLLALAAAPDVAQTGLVFALYTTPGGLRVTRYQLVNNVLTAPATILDGLPMAEQDPHAALSVGPDGMLYVALGEVGAGGGPGDLGDWAGKLLRFAPDGTTPRDQRSGSPVIVDGLRAPESIAWTGPGDVWISDLRTDSELTVVHAVRILNVWHDQTFAVPLPASMRTHGLVIAENGSLWSTLVTTDGMAQSLLHLTVSSERGMTSALEPLEEQVSAFALPTSDRTTYAWTSRGLFGWVSAPR